MKKWLCFILAGMLFVLTSCSSSPAAPKGEEPREVLKVYLDGVDLKDAGYGYQDVKGALQSKEIDKVTYYGAAVSKITGKDVSSAKGAFLQTADGSFTYLAGADVFLAPYVLDNGQYQSVAQNGKGAYDAVVAGSTAVSGVTAVYLVTNAADFKVEIQKNGTKIGELTILDCLKKTQVDGKAAAAALFDGSFLYNSGQSTYKGSFLGFDYKTLLALLQDKKLDLSGTIAKVEYTGYIGTGKAGTNQEYSTKEGDEKYFGAVKFFCLFDGMNYNKLTTDTPVGLSCFIDGTGSRWVTFNITTINFITK